jgi:hypothetical protein
LIRVSQFASRQNNPPPTRTGGMRGTLVPSLKVGAHHIELVLDAPDAAVERADIQLALELAAAEGGVALRIDRLVQLKRTSRIGGADTGDIVAGVCR